MNNPRCAVAAHFIERLAVILKEHLGKTLHGANGRAEIVGNGIGKGFESGVRFLERFFGFFSNDYFSLELGIGGLQFFGAMRKGLVEIFDFLFGPFCVGDIASKQIEKFFRAVRGDGPGKKAVSSIQAPI